MNGRPVPLHVLLAVVLTLVSALAQADPASDAEQAEARFEESRARVDRSIAKLPRRLQHAVGLGVKTALAPLRGVGAGVSRNLATGFHESISTHLDHASDMMDAIAAEFEEISEKRIEELDQKTRRRIAELEVMTEQAVAELRKTLDDAIDHASDSLVLAEEQAGVTAQRVVDRSLVEAVGYAATAIFLVGLLATGLRIFAFLQSGATRELRGGDALLAGLGAAAVLLALAASLLVSFRPELLAARYARIEIPLGPDPCVLYEIQLARAARVEQLGHEDLQLVMRQRLEDARSACLDVE